MIMSLIVYEQSNCVDIGNFQLGFANTYNSIRVNNTFFTISYTQILLMNTICTI